MEHPQTPLSHPLHPPQIEDWVAGGVQRIHHDEDVGYQVDVFRPEVDSREEVEEEHYYCCRDVEEEIDP